MGYCPLKTILFEVQKKKRKPVLSSEEETSKSISPTPKEQNTGFQVKIQAFVLKIRTDVIGM